MESLIIRTPTSPPVIAPILGPNKRPLWSVMIPTYNCTAYLVEAIISILAQDIGEENMQIEVVDDASTDADVAQLVAELGGGRVHYFRQSANVGSLRNFETCLNRSHGHLIHLLHGDDRVLPGFYEQLTQLVQQYPQAGAFFSSFACIDNVGDRTFIPPPIPEQGILQNWLLRIAEHQYIQYASIVVRREVYEKLGGFYCTHYGEDWEMWVRIARHYPMAYTPQILAEYREHAASISSEKARLGHIPADLTRVIDAIQQHLPAEERKRMSSLSKRRYATFSLNDAYRRVKDTQNWSLVQLQISQALEMSQHPLVYYHIFKFYIKLSILRYSIHTKKL
jgi:glycosyltransferase involved in cell wall biosynthesis